MTVVFRKRAQLSYRRIRVAVARINSYLQEHITGIRVVQLFNREERSCQEFSDINQTHVDAYKQAIVAYSWYFPMVEFSSMLIMASLLAYGGY